MRGGIRECTQVAIHGFELAIGCFELCGALGHALRQRDVLHTQPAQGERAREHREDHAQVKGLEDVVVRARFHGCDRRLDRAMARHHDAHQVRIDRARRSQ